MKKIKFMQIANNYSSFFLLPSFFVNHRIKARRDKCLGHIPSSSLQEKHSFSSGFLLGVFFVVQEIKMIQAAQYNANCGYR